MNALLVIGMLVVITLVHETAHTLVAIGLGYKLKKLYLGIPISFAIRGKVFSSTLVKKEIHGVEYGLSWLILGGTVDFYNFDSAAAWKITLVALAGPASNAALAFGSLWLIAGYDAAVMVTSALIQAVTIGLTLVATGHVGLDQLTGPVGFVLALSDVAVRYPLGWLLVWNVTNIALMVTNLIPIPILDGGQALFAWVSQIFGQKAKAPVRYLTEASLYLMCALMLVVMAGDIVRGLSVTLAIFLRGV